MPVQSSAADVWTCHCLKCSNIGFINIGAMVALFVKASTLIQYVLMVWMNGGSNPAWDRDLYIRLNFWIKRRYKPAVYKNIGIQASALMFECRSAAVGHRDKSFSDCRGANELVRLSDPKNMLFLKRAFYNRFKFLIKAWKLNYIIYWELHFLDINIRVENAPLHKSTCFSFYVGCCCYFHLPTSSVDKWSYKNI